MLRKGVYPYEYMDSCKRFEETSLPEKKDFYINLKMEDIIDAHYKHAKRIWKNFEIKNLGEYRDLYAQNNTLFFAEVFESFRIKCIEIHEIDPAHFWAMSQKLPVDDFEWKKRFPNLMKIL